MSSIYPTPSVTLQQPSMGPDAFKGFDQNWNVGLCNCCDDISQCNINSFIKTFLMISMHRTFTI